MQNALLALVDSPSTVVMVDERIRNGCNLDILSRHAIVFAMPQHID
jgi:hypothetical protein